MKAQIPPKILNFIPETRSTPSGGGFVKNGPCDDRRAERNRVYNSAWKSQARLEAPLVPPPQPQRPAI